ncbi:MAG: hypothetical protein GC187_11905 [Alphaproteobacteria bacterium]|nr:hypothetical protein [Alphaproteobacteria bacterium]
MQRNAGERRAEAFLDAEMNRALALGSQPAKIQRAVLAVERAAEAVGFVFANGVEVEPRRLVARRGETEVRATEEGGGVWRFEIFSGGTVVQEFRGRRA